MRCIGIDYGERRVGLSYGDEIGVATPVDAAVQDFEFERIDYLVKLARDREATDLVIGYPYNMDGSVGFKAKEVDAFIEKILAKIDLPIHRVDERLTSHVASEGFSKKRDDALRRSGKIDSAAAALILQDFLDQRVALPEHDPYENEEQ
ncbi:MAG: Holliday junction resolvase RuvX [Opitutales bacterium]|jgi:putative holliday junction resolvase|nr:Holliday junction resolvase RuvX [Opitutales bacterium]MBT5167515.1 Holliday junction resolvase RuvX [Opitutales bacterium]MBT5813437.1 Holliday junction resolvase RuvX [Opitutales bacterium]MBT6768867.1 Holliday junction resolvase RuvX [Opitutales bacterium]